LSACAPEPAGFVVSETVSAHAVRLPMITVRRGDGAPFSREDWVVAETAARDHCAGRGAVYSRLPPSRDYTEMRLEDGLFAFMARCVPR
jgi:hypothetical protein